MLCDCDVRHVTVTCDRDMGHVKFNYLFLLIFGLSGGFNWSLNISFRKYLLIFYGLLRYFEQKKNSPGGNSQLETVQLVALVSTVPK